MIQENPSKQKSNNQKRFENSRKSYSDTDILMELLYNSRLSREATLLAVKYYKIIAYMCIAIFIISFIFLLLRIKSGF